ncbi:dienelactone hydrolase family protein [Rhodococcus sp. NBC_00297]|jgi:carboxymethylenebutenolidase|uniref:dienelactone hydrolase family protein n=1 Tax=Rhodococcus sp. NBC_00297 TaxID=2976005 RepID=UPI002E2C5683|nr:dienelactone hydrolase family protein [Rhodococcus sp. NBC_00297]
MAITFTTRVPEGPIRGGVVVVQEAFGVTDHIAEVCGRFASAGWIAVAPHLFHRAGDPVVSYDDMGTAMDLIGALKAEEIDQDVDAAFDELAGYGYGPSGCAIVGFCMGGTVAFETAVRRPLGAAATFYGGGIREGRFGYPPLLDGATALRTPWHGFFGDLDTGIPVDDVDSLNAAVTDAQVDTRIARYPDAEHGFHCNDRPAVYNERAAYDAWSRTLDWFDLHVDPAGEQGRAPRG